MNAELDPLVDSIYDAAGGGPSTDWETLLAEIADRVGATGGVIFGQSFSGKQVFYSHHGRMDPDCSVIYHQRHMDNVLSRSMLRRPAGRLVQSDEVIALPALRRTEFWHDVLRPQRIDHSAMVTLANQEDFQVSFIICRGSAAGAYSEREMCRLAQLLPHLKRSMQLRMRVEAYAALSTAAFSILEQISTACVVLDGRANVLFANRSALRLHGADGPINLRDGTVVARDPLDSARFAALVRSALCGGPGGVIRFAGPRRSTPLFGVAAPLRGQLVRGLHSEGIARAGAVVFVSRRPGRAALHILRDIYGLTAAETRIAAKLADGLTTGEVASALGVSPNTVKTHVRRIFDKTDVHRQSEFANLLSALQSIELTCDGAPSA